MTKIIVSYAPGITVGHFVMIIDDVIQEASYESASFGTVQDLSHKDHPAHDADERLVV